MLKRDYVDVASGALLALLGVAVVAYAYFYLRIGTFQRMGPGMFPIGIGSFIALLGTILSLSGLVRQGAMPAAPALRPVFFVTCGILSFYLLLRPMGLVPAVAALVVVSSLGEAGFKPKRLTLLVAFLSALTVAVFKYALGMNFAIFSPGTI